jgi:paraquat-inducible protein A
MQNVHACHCCGLIQSIEGNSTSSFYCVRCNSKLTIHRVIHWSRDPSLAFAIAALVLYFPAILLPILKIDQFGKHYTSSLLSGTIELFQHGSWFVGGVVLLFSIVLPFMKILGILELTLLQLFGQSHRAWVYRIVELAGRWGMLDVLLLALLVMMVKLGNTIEFHLGPAVFVFVACVGCNMLASLFFNPHAVWQQEQTL